MLRRLCCLIFVVLIGLILPSVAFVKGVPDYYTVEGAGIHRPLRFQPNLMISIFDPTRALDEAPTVTREPFIVRAYFDGEELNVGSPLHYYFQTDGSAYMHYVSAQDRGVHTEFDGRWFTATPEAASWLEQMIRAARYRNLHLGIE